MNIEKVGRYEVVKVLGRGAMGVVYLARDPIIDRKLAVKTLRLDLDAARNVTDETAQAQALGGPQGRLGMINGTLNPMQAFMSGRITVDGDMTIVMQMQAIQMQAAMAAGGGSGGVGTA